jgi:hypothetical protein
LSRCLQTLDQFDPASLHIVIPRIVFENARVNLKTRLPDPRLLNRNADPPRYTPLRKDDITLPSSADIASTWVWMSNWSVSPNDASSHSDGWRFARRWDTPDAEWVNDPTITPISRSGLVARRTWLRIMKKCPAGQQYLGNMDLSENEDIEFQTSSALEIGSSPTGMHAARPNQPVRTNSMSARLVGLVAGTSKGK